jgi:transposase
LLPDATTLRLQACTIDEAAAQITLDVRSTQATARCPLCTTPAQRLHSHYERTLADLPWAAYRVRLQLRVRKWFCPNPHCRRRIFTERNHQGKGNVLLFPAVSPDPEYTDPIQCRERLGGLLKYYTHEAA